MPTDVKLFVEVMNILKSYMRTAGWRIIWKKIIAVIEAPFPVAKRKPENIQRPAPGWLVRSIGRALHRYRRGQGFESRTSLNFFRLSFRNCKSCVYNCDDLLSYELFVLKHNWEPHQADHTFWPLISTPKITSITGQKQLINGWQEIETRNNTNQNYDTTLNSNTTPKTHEGWMGGWGQIREWQMATKTDLYKTMWPEDSRTL